MKFSEQFEAALARATTYPIHHRELEAARSDFMQFCEEHKDTIVVALRATDAQEPGDGQVS